MKLSSFKFEIPESLIAERPTEHRDESRLMVVNRKDGSITHEVFKNIHKYFDKGDLFLMNNTKVFPSRVYGRKEKTGAKIEVFLLRELNRENLLWDVLVEPARKIRIGNKLYFGEDGLVAEVIDNTTSRGRSIRFLYDGPYDEFYKTLKELGSPPIPKYIKRPVEDIDYERYQTIYAKNEGAVAAPTAGLHIDKNLLKIFEIKDIETTFLTLHVGLGTFRKVEVEDLTKHKMDSEHVIISQECADSVNKVKTRGNKICLVGTTTMRAVESSLSTNGELKPYDDWTYKFIFPPYKFSIADSMVTNFHMPESTLLMMVSAFGGFDLIKEAYQIAIREKYRFYSYGDAMLIL